MRCVQTSGPVRRTVGVQGKPNEMENRASFKERLVQQAAGVRMAFPPGVA